MPVKRYFQDKAASSCRSGCPSFDVLVEHGIIGRAPGRLPTLNLGPQENLMRVMVMVRAGKDYEAGAMPGQKLIAEMGKFNQELVKAGGLLAADGLHPSFKRQRATLSGQQSTVQDWPLKQNKVERGRHLA